jgi:N-acetylglucosamine malate deacetylase 1
MASFLCIAPHPDDAELAMGGTLIKLKRQGHQVHICDMTNGEPTPKGSPEQREREWTEAARIMGLSRTNLGLKNREVQHTLEARHKLAAVIRAHKPNVLFVPYPVDAHPDHLAVSRIAVDARFDAKLTKSAIPGEPWHPKRIIYYFCTHLKLAMMPSFCVDISDTVDDKIKAFRAYVTQVDDEFERRVRLAHDHFGERIGVRAAEPFYSDEVLGFGGLDQLV